MFNTILEGVEMLIYILISSWELDGDGFWPFGGNQMGKSLHKTVLKKVTRPAGET